MESKELKVPLDRVAVLIGKDGVVKRKIEAAMHVKLLVDSKEGDVVIEGEDSLQVYETQAIVKAVARGFHPDRALLLQDERYSFDLINVQDYVGHSKKRVLRMKGRVIGREGKARKMVEDATDCSISVYGKTIGFIGRVEDVPVARQAMEMLLEGSPHGNVFKWLEIKKQEAIRRRFENKEL